MLPQMLDHIIRTFFPGIWRAPAGSLREVQCLLVSSKTVCERSIANPLWKSASRMHVKLAADSYGSDVMTMRHCLASG